MTTVKKENQKPAKVRGLATGEIRGVTYIVMIVVGICVAILRVVAGALGLPAVLMNDCYWWIMWFVVSMIVTMFMIGKVEKGEQTSNTRYIKGQSKDRKRFARQLGLRYRPPQESDNLYSGGILSGTYEDRTFTIDSDMADLTTPYVIIWFTQIETPLENAKGLSLALWMNDYQLKKYIQGEETGDIEFNYTNENVELVQKLLRGSYRYKERFVELGAYHIVANEGTLLIKFKEGRPDISQLRSFLDLTRDVAEKIEAFAAEHQAAA